MSMFFQENWLTCKGCTGRLFFERPVRAYLIDHDELTYVEKAVEIVCTHCGNVADTKKQGQIRPAQGGM